MLRVYLLFFGISFVFGDLYNSSDPLVILDADNFYESILGSKNGWIVEFYNSYCGHCIHYAPKWREFSKDVKDWDHTLKVGALDCANKENVAICRDYEIMAYPSVRLFGASTKKGDIGVQVQKIEVEEMQEEIVDFIIDKQNQSIASASWKNLLEYNNSIKGIFTNSLSQVENAVLIAEESDSKMGSQTILDLGNYPSVYIRRIKANSKELSGFGISSYPSVIIVNRELKTEVLSQKVKSRLELTALIKDKFKFPQETQLKDDIATDAESSTTAAAEKADSFADEVNADRLDYDASLPDAAYTSNTAAKKKTKVFVVDIENALSYALRHEVALNKVISGVALDALKRFLHVLVKYLPAQPHVTTFLDKLRHFVNNTEDTLPISSYESALAFIASPSSVLPDEQPWIGCLGSAPKYRGYTCGLWTLFHTLTVNALVKHEEGGASVDPLEPLRGIHGYVKHFFRCEHCSKHFQEMYKLDAEAVVKSPQDGVMWLFTGHNKVNKRIHGELSEDPKHPKIEFPSDEACHSCRTNGSLNPKEVLRFLKNIHGRESLSLKGTQELRPEPNYSLANRQAKVFNSVKEKFLAGKSSNSNLGPTIQKVNTTSWGFNSTDVSVCILLYVCSTCIIVSGYMMFLLKRRLRRKKYVETYKRP